MVSKVPMRSPKDLTTNQTVEGNNKGITPTTTLKLLSRIRRSLPLFAIALSLTFVSEVNIQPGSVTWEIGQQAEARKRSGGRSGGGSFRNRSSGSSSQRDNSRPSNSGSSNSNSNNNSTSPSSRTRDTDVIVVPSGGSSYNSGGSNLGMFILLGFFGIVALIVVAGMLSGGSNSSTASVPSATELENDIVTISKLQVALFADASEVQSQLSELSLNVDTDSEEGLLELLQESVLVLLRHSEYWSHVLSSSESIRIDTAEQAFNKLSFTERSKFSSETLTNINGRTKQEEVVAPTDEDSAAYIVVTLITGTADDKPLFGDIHSLEELQEALERVASIPADYLMKFELLWSPQAENDSLTYDELLTEYTNMIQLV